MTVDNSVRLNYVDKLWGYLTSQNKRLDRTFLIQVFISLLLISVYTGLVTIEQKTSILGLSFQATPVTFLTWLSVIVLALYIYQAHLITSIRQNRSSLIEHYSKLGMDIDKKQVIFEGSIISFVAGHFEFDQPMRRLDRLLIIPFVVTILLVIFVVPLLGVMFTLFQLLSYTSLNWFLKVLIIVFVLSSPFSYLIIRIRNS